ncbi:succinate dehydrogenase, cytochrome b556 subunit [Prosthecochloris sp. CIB 2401]|nr:succinate dehydrogenase, cytochrome b556 subunit [Prosthecochloris sp. CIB 2401]
MRLLTRNDIPSLKNFIATVVSMTPKPGMVAWLLHRLTGLFLVLYLVLHTLGLRSMGDPVAFEKYVTMYRQPLFKFAEFLLLGVVAYHAFNGIRIILQDMFFRSGTERPLFYLVLLLTVMITVVGGYHIIYPYFIAPLLLWWGL